MKRYFQFLMCFSFIAILGQTSYAETAKTSPKEDVSDKKYELVSGTDFVSLGKNGDWESFFLEQGNETICWASTKPISTLDEKGKKVSLDKPASVLITSIRPDHNIRNEISYHTDKKLNEDKTHIISVDSKTKFHLSAQGHWAWLKSSLEENRFVLSAQNGNKLSIKIFLPEEGKKYTEQFSLKGYTKAYQVAVGRCAEFFDDKKKTEKEKPKT